MFFKYLELATYIKDTNVCLANQQYGGALRSYIGHRALVITLNRLVAAKNLYGEMHEVLLIPE